MSSFSPMRIMLKPFSSILSTKKCRTFSGTLSPISMYSTINDTSLMCALISLTFHGTKTHPTPVSLIFLMSTRVINVSFSPMTIIFLSAMLSHLHVYSEISASMPSQSKPFNFFAISFIFLSSSGGSEYCDRLSSIISTES